MSHLPFQFFAWAASIAYMVETIQAKFISKHKIENPWLFNFVWLVFLLIMNTVVCLWAGATVPHVWGNVILVGIFFALGMSLFTLANYKLDVSVLTPLSNFHTIFVVILGVLFLNENLSSLQLSLIVIMFIAAMLVTYDENFSLKSFFNKGVFISLASMLCYALMAMFLKKASAEVPFWTLNLWYFFIGAVLMMFTLPLFKNDIKSLNKNQLWNVLFLSLAGTVATLLANKAYTSNISISGAIIYIPLSVIVVMLLSSFFPKFLEHHTWKVYLVRIISTAVLVYAGIMLI
jgi:drug/metabolite transporter (DMT)-like permease